MRWLPLLLAIGCGNTANPIGDVVAPFHGPIRRYAVDSLMLPDHRMVYAADLNGDGKVDNQFGNIVGSLAANLNLVHSVDDLIAAGVLRSVVEISAADLSEDTRAGVRLQGREGDGGDFVGGTFGTLRPGDFQSNLTSRTTHPAAMTVRLPVFVDVDPMVVHLFGVQIELVKDGDGYNGRFHGALIAVDAESLATSGMLAMLAANPYDHPYVYQIFDLDDDSVISAEEISTNSLVTYVVDSDVALLDDAGNWHPDPNNAGKDSLSFGFAFHLVPCDSGSCTLGAPVDTCHDRAIDGGETDVDCGGGSACMRCLDGRACQSDGDCRSGRCGGGLCSPTGCSNQRLDGDESDLDCGGSCPVRCTQGWHCRSDGDCADGLQCVDGGFSGSVFACS